MSLSEKLMLKGMIKTLEGLKELAAAHKEGFDQREVQDVIDDILSGNPGISKNVAFHQSSQDTMYIHFWSSEEIDMSDTYQYLSNNNLIQDRGVGVGVTTIDLTNYEVTILFFDMGIARLKHSLNSL